MKMAVKRGKHMLYETHYKEGKKINFKKMDLSIAGLLFLRNSLLSPFSFLKASLLK